MAINTANDLYISINDELRPWSDVSQDIIEYLKKKVDAITNALVYKGSVETIEDLNSIENPSLGDMYNVISDNNNNYAWNGTEWDSLGPLAQTIDREAIENSENAIQSGFIYNALMNYATYEQVQRIIDEVFSGENLADITRNVSQELSDIHQDITDINAKLLDIPDPLVSRDINNAIIRGSDNGLYADDKTSSITQLQNNVNTINSTLEQISGNSIASEVSEILEVTDEEVTIGIEDENVIYMKVSGEVVLNFTPSDNEKAFSQKYLYLEATDSVSLSVQNANWAMIQEQPTFYEAGYYLLAKIIWIGGNVIVQTIDVNQMPDGVA